VIFRLLGVCGLSARCSVQQHIPICTCIEGYQGNPFTACYPIPPEPERIKEPSDPCVPNPCGPFSQCRNVNGQAICSCQPGYIGSPPSCRPECTVSSECPDDKACVNLKCTNPCAPNPCASNANCRVRNHSPICSCPPEHQGDPFVRCYPSK